MDAPVVDRITEIGIRPHPTGDFERTRTRTTLHDERRAVGCICNRTNILFHRRRGTALGQAAAIALLKRLRAILGEELPLLFTCRTKCEVVQTRKDGMTALHRKASSSSSSSAAAAAAAAAAAIALFAALH
jgi:hypothetical protein